MILLFIIYVYYGTAYVAHARSMSVYETDSCVFVLLFSGKIHKSPLIVIISSNDKGGIMGVFWFLFHVYLIWIFKKSLAYIFFQYTLKSDLYVT